MLEINLFGLVSQRVPLWDKRFLISSFPFATQQFRVEMVR